MRKMLIEYENKLTKLKENISEIRAMPGAANFSAIAKWPKITIMLAINPTSEGVLHQ